VNDYHPDNMRDPVDLAIAAQSGPEPRFDTVMNDFLLESRDELKRRCSPDSLVEVVSLGREAPWLYRLTFRTLGLGRDSETDEVYQVNRHTIALRFLPDYLRRARQFEMLQYVEPRQPAPFHPNICPNTGAICLEVYPGETALQIVESLHDLLRWRIRQLAEQDALNKAACSYGRAFVTQAIDERPLFGCQFELRFEPVEAQP
jgi:hypothetical protein